MALRRRRRLLACTAVGAGLVLVVSARAPRLLAGTGPGDIGAWELAFSSLVLQWLALLAGAGAALARLPRRADTAATLLGVGLYGLGTGTLVLMGGGVMAAWLDPLGGEALLLGVALSVVGALCLLRVPRVVAVGVGILAAGVVLVPLVAALNYVVLAPPPVWLLLDGAVAALLLLSLPLAALRHRRAVAWPLSLAGGGVAVTVAARSATVELGQDVPVLARWALVVLFGVISVTILDLTCCHEDTRPTRP